MISLDLSRSSPLVPCLIVYSEFTLGPQPRHLSRLRTLYLSWHSDQTSEKQERYEGSEDFDMKRKLTKRTASGIRSNSPHAHFTLRPPDRLPRSRTDPRPDRTPRTPPPLILLESPFPVHSTPQSRQVDSSLSNQFFEIPPAWVAPDRGCGSGDFTGKGYGAQ